jgi:5-formyltetrahydrofolate cyclo-ligase
MVDRLKGLDADQRWRAGRAASDRLVELLTARIPAGEPIALFSATATELPCDAAIGALAGRHPLLFPRLDGGGLVFARSAVEALEPGPVGIRQPPAAAPLGMPAAVVLPGRAFDRRGFRLGRGAGHYDRALSALSADVLLVGFAFALQIVDILSAEPHDVPVHVVVTELGEPLHRRLRAVPHASPTASPLPAAAHD